MLVELESISNSLETRLGISRPNWRVIWDWVDKHVPEDQLHEAWTAIAGQWLRKLQSALGGSYDVRESEEFLLLSAAEVSVSDRLLRWCEYYRQSILEVLAGVAQ